MNQSVLEFNNFFANSVQEEIYKLQWPSFESSTILVDILPCKFHCLASEQTFSFFIVLGKSRFTSHVMNALQQRNSNV